MIMTSIRK